jgi:hypothetical protein
MCLLFIVVSRGTMTMIDGRGCVFRMGMGDSEVCESSSVPVVRVNEAAGKMMRARHASTRGRRRSTRGGSFSIDATGRIGALSEVDDARRREPTVIH